DHGGMHHSVQRACRQCSLQLAPFRQIDLEIADALVNTGEEVPDPGIRLGDVCNEDIVPLTCERPGHTHPHETRATCHQYPHGVTFLQSADSISWMVGCETAILTRSERDGNDFAGTTRPQRRRSTLPGQ